MHKLAAMDDLQIQLEHAIAASDKGENEEAIRRYEQILSEKEDWSKPHYNLGLIYKYKREWDKSYHHNKRAVELNPKNEAGQWNLGIAATMMRDWKLARRCWNFFGRDYETSDEDTAGDLGISPVRINPQTEGEIVWTTRICPARAIIENIPYPESNHRYKDMVLNDGAPNGYRVSNGKEYAVFDEIQHLSCSNYQIFSVRCVLNNENYFKSLQAKCEDADIAIENWTTSVRFLCRQCSEGKPHERHDHELINRADENLTAFASTSQEKLVLVLEAWSNETRIDYYDSHFY
jgi:hypothetical protein